MGRRARTRAGTEPAPSGEILPAAEPVPRRLRRGPPITLTCDCGESRAVHYGERWCCEKCGRTWNTRRIPADQYAAVRRIRTRFVMVPVTVLLAIIATVALFVAFGRVYVVILLPFALALWSMYGRQLHRRRLHQALGRLPRWKIEPE
ncbi:MAG: hypothetical protein ACRDL5_18280 [Solirubrobacteraceae bacterium]